MPQTPARSRTAPPSSPPVPFREALRVWVRIGLQSFGGPAGQIAVMHRILVDEKRWIDEPRFLHALNYCMLLPGPEAMQLATYVGWLLHGTRGGLTAGLLFILPGFLSILALSLLYVSFQGLALVEGLFFGLKAAVLVVVVEALLRIGRRVLKNGLMGAVAAASFIGIFLLDAPFPLIVGLAAALGWFGGRIRPDLFAVIARPGVDLTADAQPTARPPLGRTLRILATYGALWAVPIVLLALALGPGHVFVDEGVFFSKAAVVTFGGAYAVLAYIGQQAVERYAWLLPGEMLDGLGMAETTPGPLIQVVQFVGFMGAYRNPGGLDPLLAATLGSVVATWVTFVPCFLWIFVGAPYVEALRGHRGLTAALSTLTAAVVGVIANLAVWFGLHVLFASVAEHEVAGLRLLVPDPASLDLPALVIGLTAALLLLRLHVGLLTTLGVCAGLGILLHLAAA